MIRRLIDWCVPDEALRSLPLYDWHAHELLVTFSGTSFDRCWDFMR